MLNQFFGVGSELGSRRLLNGSVHSVGHYRLLDCVISNFVDSHVVRGGLRFQTGSVIDRGRRGVRGKFGTTGEGQSECRKRGNHAKASLQEFFWHSPKFKPKATEFRMPTGLDLVTSLQS